MRKPEWLGPERYRVTAYKGDEEIGKYTGLAPDQDLYWLITDCLHTRCTRIEIVKEEPK